MKKTMKSVKICHISKIRFTDRTGRRSNKLIEDNCSRDPLGGGDTVDG